ncbi:MAG: helix-turn-helix transcriptional regulator [Ancrocorticia sp.]|jgi:DNA-binding CsgD family transcriptional regulator/tetratricopeptide (TPR) repeat protein|nr:helix-turn-helix transcriptional regulator [Ancrocorticia sp.]MCI2193033.1 helix-turn-helix transcriptional regulator [Ancrocorticia sp.]MCI2198485.1 helix-turn-helix transcriptional regulator [Ancrocorticia sp.]
MTASNPPIVPSATPIGGAWKEVDRLAQVLDVFMIPRFSVLAALPGWGKTTFLTQTTRRARAASIPFIWLVSRDTVESFLQRDGTDHPVYVFIDDVLTTATDPLWIALGDYAARHPKYRFMVSSIDIPTFKAPDSVDVTVRSEELLGFRPSELVTLFNLNGAQTSITPLLEKTDSPRIRALRCPAIVRSYLETTTNPQHVGGWPGLADHSGVAVLEELRKIPPAIWRESVMLQMLYQLASFRRASTHMLVSAQRLYHGDATAVSRIGDTAARGPAVALKQSDVPITVFTAHFDRLEHLPLGAITTDQETGQRMFEWYDDVWKEIRKNSLYSHNWISLDQASEVSSQTGYTALRLFYTLETGNVDAAERDAYQNYRYWIVSADALTYEKLWSLPWHDIATRPGLLLLLGTLHIKNTGSVPQAKRFLLQALRLLEKLPTQTPHDQFVALTRRLHAHVLLGERRPASRILTSIWDMIRPGPDNIVNDLVSDDEAREGFAANLFFPLWAAIQLDRHAPAIYITRLMQTFKNPQSPTARIEEIAAQTECVLGGNGDPNHHLVVDGVLHTDPLALLDAGRDDDACELITSFAARNHPVPSSSAADGLTLLIAALTQPQSLDPESIERVIKKSQHFWDDHKASSFVCASAAAAYLALGDANTARETLRLAYRKDWFIRCALAAIYLAQADPSAALTTLAHAPHWENIPRARAIAATLSAAAYAQLKNDVSAIKQLEILNAAPVRYSARSALRLITDDDFDALTALSLDLPIPIQNVFTAASRDRRVFQRVKTLTLTPTEKELLRLAREGHSNGDIARIRVVSLNTVRSQMRTLFRKLEVTSRAEAVMWAERHGIFQ